jgi:hypothetical protein
MTVAELQRTLRAVSSPPALPPVDEAALASSARYLASSGALESVERDVYWPKWDSPWWHMLLLFELDEAHRIPRRMVETMAAQLDRQPLHIFPIHEGEAPPGTDPSHQVMCHCALGSMHQVLTACGVDVAAALPWIEPWFDRYQMADGGASCDETAYLSAECASSMVATIAPLEAMLARPPSPFADRAAGFLIDRQLVNGSSSQHNAEEQTAALSWPNVSFPRFYFYDVLRGLSALVKWATVHERAVPIAALAPALAHLALAFPDGVVRVQRQAFIDTGTRLHVDGRWQRQSRALSFQLLEATSVLGAPSATLTRRWTHTRRELLALIEAGRVA